MSHILVVDDEEAVCWALQRALRRDGQSVDVAASAEEAFKARRRSNRRTPSCSTFLFPARPGRTLRPRATEATLPGRAGHRRHGVRQSPHCGAGFVEEARSITWPSRSTSTTRRRCARGPCKRAPGFTGAGPTAAGRNPGARVPGGHRWVQRRDADGVQADRPGRVTRLLRAGHRRERHRQGAGCPRPASLQRPSGSTIFAHTRRRSQPGTRRKRAVRPCERCVHRRRASSARTAWAGGRRHGVPRRAGRYPAVGAGKAAARA